MTEYRVTFGGQYGSPEYGADPHPVLGSYAHRDGWLTILASNEAAARDLVGTLLAESWSNLYDVRDLSPEAWADHFPRGELLRLVHPDMAGLPVALLRGESHHGGTRQMLVTVWGDGTGEVAWRVRDTDTWGPPRPLAPAHRGAGA